MSISQLLLQAPDHQIAQPELGVRHYRFDTRSVRRIRSQGDQIHSGESRPQKGADLLQRRLGGVDKVLVLDEKRVATARFAVLCVRSGAKPPGQRLDHRVISSRIVPDVAHVLVRAQSVGRIPH